MPLLNQVVIDLTVVVSQPDFWKHQPASPLPSEIPNCGAAAVAAPVCCQPRDGHGHWLGDLDKKMHKDEMMMILPYFLGGKGHHKKLKRKKGPMMFSLKLQKICR